MKHIKSYRVFEASIYDSDWNEIMPKRMTVLKDGEHSFKLGNIMKHSDMVQATYENENAEWGIPSTLELDFYFSHNGHMRIDIDITWGDAMACEFYVESPNKLGIIEYTSSHSKMDPSNTVFALEDESLKQLIEFINRFEGFNLSRGQFNFLDKYDNYLPN